MVSWFSVRATVHDAPQPEAVEAGEVTKTPPAVERVNATLAVPEAVDRVIVKVIVWPSVGGGGAIIENMYTGVLSIKLIICIRQGMTMVPAMVSPDVHETLEIEMVNGMFAFEVPSNNEVKVIVAVPVGDGKDTEDGCESCGGALEYPKLAVHVSAPPTDPAPERETVKVTDVPSSMLVVEDVKHRGTFLSVRVIVAMLADEVYDPGPVSEPRVTSIVAPFMVYVSPSSSKKEKVYAPFDDPQETIGGGEHGDGHE